MKSFISTDLQKAIEADELFIAARLKSLRVRAVLALDDFAEALGVETEELSAYENGEEDIPASVIALVCALSGVPYEYFFGSDEDGSSGNIPAAQTVNSVTDEHVVLLN